MRLHFKDRGAPETLNLFAIVVLMGLFAAGLFYAGASFRVPPRTAQLAVPNSEPF